MQLPEDLVEAVANARRPCRWFEQGKCKKGHRCSLLHRTSEENVSHFPFVSCTVNSDGERRVQVRPPLRQALEKFFKLPGDELPVQSGKQVDDLIVFPL